MTIRSNIDAREANRLYMAFEAACDNAPAGTMIRAKEIRASIGEACDAFLASMKALNVSACNCDGIREIEALMFDNIRRKNTTGVVPAAIGFGLALLETEDPADQTTIINRVRRDGDFWASREDWQRMGMVEQD